jgi:hypothetical protein
MYSPSDSECDRLPQLSLSKTNASEGKGFEALIKEIINLGLARL